MIAASDLDGLAAHFDETQILEAIALVGYYHTISFLCRGLELPLEAYAARFPLTPPQPPRIRPMMRPQPDFIAS